jgi:beta-phosphoglucomutase-like phosphatase (HAD superfamily)
MESIKAVIFDMDGLMFDTERLCMWAWNQVAGELGREIPESTYMACVGTNNRDTRRIILDELGADFPYEEFYSRARVLMRQEMDRAGPPEKTGLRTLLEFLAKHRIPAAVATSSSRETALWMIDRAGLTGYFTAFAFGNEVTQGKPAPDIFLAALDRLNQARSATAGNPQNEDTAILPALLPAQCIVLEDSPAGLTGAAAAGMNPVFIKDIAEPSADVLALVKASPRNLAEVIELIANF